MKPFHFTYVRRFFSGVLSTFAETGVSPAVRDIITSAFSVLMLFVCLPALIYTGQHLRIAAQTVGGGMHAGSHRGEHAALHHWGRCQSQFIRVLYRIAFPCAFSLPVFTVINRGRFLTNALAVTVGMMM